MSSPMKNTVLSKKQSVKSIVVLSENEGCSRHDGDMITDHVDAEADSNSSVSSRNLRVTQ